MLNRPPETLGSPRSETAASPNLVEFYGGSVRRPSSFTLLPPNNGATNDSLLHNSVLGQSGLRRSSFTRRSFAAGGVVSVGTSFNNSTLRHRPSLTSSSAFGQFMPETPSTLGGVSSTKVLTPRDGRIPPIAPVSAASPPRLAEEEGSQSPRPLIQAQPSLDVDTLAATKTSSLTGSADVSLNCSPMIRTPSGAGAKAVRMMFGSKPRDDDSNTPLPTAPPLQLEAPPPPMPPRKVHGSRGVAAVLGSRAQPASPVQLPVSALKSPYSRQRSDSVLSLEASPIPMPPAESRDPSVRPAMRPNHADNPGSPSGNNLKTFAAFGASPPCPDLQPSPVVKRLVDGDVSVTLIEALDDEFDDDDDDPEAITFDSADNSPLAHNIGLVEVVRPTKNRSSKTASSSSGATTGKRRDTLSVANTAGSNRSPHSPRSPLEEMLGSTLFTSKHDNAGHKMNMSFSSNRIDDDNGDPDTVDNFSFYGKIGEGACGVVFKALDEESLTEHAVKELKRPLGGPDNITEVRVMRALPQHPHVCPMLEIIDDVANKKVLMVMPLYAGAVAEVDAATFTCKALPPASVCAVAIQIGSALRHCHEHGIVHGDIKPENILTDGKPPRRHSGTEMSFQFPLTACLADFGASVICTSNKLGLSLRSRPDDESSDEEHDGDDDMHVESLRQMGLVTHVGGSPAYLAPESLIGMTKPTEMTDMWAFGVTLFALLFGAHPFPSESILELRDKVAHRPPQYPDSQRKTAALRPWRMILDGLLDKDPDKRWSADKLLTSTALARAVQALNTGASC